MKKHYFIYLSVFLLFSNCENTVVNEPSDEATDTSLRSPNSYYTGNTLFLDIYQYHDFSGHSPCGFRGDALTRGIIYSQFGATYTFVYATNRVSTVKYTVDMHGDYNVVSNGYAEFSLYVPAGKMSLIRTYIEFSELWRFGPPIVGESRLVITKINGKSITGYETGFCDLITLSEATCAGGGSNSSSDYHWKCNYCGFLNSDMNNRHSCVGCNTSRP